MARSFRVARSPSRPCVTLACCLVLAAGLLSVSAHAKQSDRSQPVNVSAQSADATASPNGISHLKGDVVITQGSLKATGDNGTIHFDSQSQVKRVVLTGKAHIQQVDDNGNLMTGDADSISYDVAKGIAILTGHARVKQAGRGSASGDKLVYDTRNSTMTAQSSGDNRVHLIFKARSTPATPGTKPAHTATSGN
ncbi:lipopolysaccharide transport periplasmic protein LptA [Oleiagrimonas sp.]|uniref:lipopolysaccharide transport periplasmic protein LptA n=1 Tax=Oleiagrimonas sp. TaxID=2010330 RepID=UPI002633B47C|nr:lipopolysaccharide transport periplasmic protein LptA [Oleiagrimonas sp.]MDA3914038.1 lipopolysaccharide transport periplasmic protein LptA [Oleiagrimonas sp.]